MRNTSARHRVRVLVLPGVVGFDLFIPTHVFGHPHEESRYEVTVCGPRRRVSTSAGMEVRVPEPLDALRTADTIVIPGYDYEQRLSTMVTSALKSAHDRGVRLVAVCTGAFAYAEAGLLDHRRATTHWHDTDELANRFPLINVEPGVLYIADESVMTSAGLAAGIDLCVHIIRLDHGEAIAAAAARRMVIAPHRQGGQAQFARPLNPRPVDSLAPLCDWIVEHLDEPLTIDLIAQRGNLSRRTLNRRFVDHLNTTPIQWLTTQRVLRARELLETTTLSIERVAELSGLTTAANLRDLFAKHVGVSPSAYRRNYTPAT